MPFAATNLLHLILDGLITPIMPFYPISKIYIGLNILKIFPIGIRDLILPTFDGILILFWILWMEFKLKVSDYF